MDIIIDIFRYLISWNKYRRYVKQLTRDNEHEMLEKLYDWKKTRGLIIGLGEFEHYWNGQLAYRRISANQEKFKKKMQKESELKLMKYMKSPTLEDIANEKEKYENLQKEVIKFDPNYRPTLSELSKYPIDIEKNISPIMYCRIYHIREKACYVGLSVVPGMDPYMIVKEKYKDVYDAIFAVFNFHDSNMPKSKKFPKEDKQVDINHVKEALGLNDKTDKELNDKLDDIF